MFFKTYIVTSALALVLFSYAQYQGWSVFGVDENRPASGSARSAYHK